MLPVHSFAQAKPSAGCADVSKKGVCFTSKDDGWWDKVKASKASWHYSWNKSLPKDEPAGVEFVPMIWGYYGAGDKFQEVIKELSAAKTNNTRTHLLGFNEPDGVKQANIEVGKAIEAWPYLMKTNLRLGSPGAVHADNEWMQSFMKQAAEKNYRVDFICVHWYGGPNVKSLLSHLKKVHELYGKPIWITEFAVADWKAKTREENHHSPEKIQAFMKEALPELDKLDYVERYAWFSGSADDKALWSSALFKEDGSLTELGKIYAAHR